MTLLTEAWIWEGCCNHLEPRWNRVVQCRRCNGLSEYKMICPLPLKTLLVWIWQAKKGSVNCFLPRLSAIKLFCGYSVFRSNKKATFFGIKTVGGLGPCSLPAISDKMTDFGLGLVEGLLIDTVSDHQSLRLEFRVIRCGPHRSEFGRINNMHILDRAASDPAIPNLLSYFHFQVHSSPLLISASGR